MQYQILDIYLHLKTGPDGPQIFSKMKNLDFAALFELSHKIEIYVPGTIHAAPALELQKQFTNIVNCELAKMFGGCTITPAAGVWFSEELNKNITENINICFSYCTAEQIQEYAGEVIDLCKQICTGMNQEAITLVYDNRATFITK